MKFGNRYEIIKELGKGGFGTVYQAHDSILDIDRALKVLHPVLVADATFLTRFRREARMAAKLDHPNLAPVYDSGESEGRFYMVMKYLPGGSLKDRLEKEGRLNEQDTLKVFLEICEGLAYAHDHQIVHRDLKPANILFDDNGSACVSDMGFAKSLTSGNSASLSVSGGMVGTPAYMAPEIWRGKTATAATDIYSLGCILYEMLTSEVLFHGTSHADVMTKHLIKRPEFSPVLPQKYVPVVQKALQPVPEDRFSSAQEMAQALLAAAQQRDRIWPHFLPEDRVELEPDSETVTAPSVEPMHRLPDGSLWMAKEDGEEAQDLSQPVESGTANAGKSALPKWLPWSMIVLLAAALAVIIPNLGREPVVTPKSVAGSRANDSVEMIYIPEGSFFMGDVTGDANEAPVHEVWLNDFTIDKYEVTNAQYANCVRAGVCQPPNSEESFTRDSYYGNTRFLNYPVIYVDWQDASTYCAWVDKRLPTEAEWEKAARGADSLLYPWGNFKPTCSLANHYDDVAGLACVGDTTPVGSYPLGVSPYGVYDMAGNVMEFVSDWFEENYYSNFAGTNPVGPSTGMYHVLRGGAFYTTWFGLRTPDRYARPSFGPGIGFRCASSD